MGTGYSFQFGSYFYDCEFGCWDFGYASDIEAERAEAEHDCCFREVSS